MDARPASVLIADERRAHAEALAFGLEQLGSEVHVEVPESAALVQCIDRVRPDVLVVDLDARTVDAVALIERVGRGSDTRVVALANGTSASVLAAAVRSGARAIVSKSSPVAELAAVIQGVSADETHIPPKWLTAVVQALLATPEPDVWAERVGRLTDRERDVLRLMAAGLSRPDIAAALYISINTVRTHARNVLAKLEVHSSVEAVSIALRAGLGPRPA
jgi:DNA-binding NarL/FixJ family response regulator